MTFPRSRSLLAINSVPMASLAGLLCAAVCRVAAAFGCCVYGGLPGFDTNNIVCTTVVVVQIVLQ